VDPISILFAAKACVAAIREGTALYKQCKESFMEVKSTYDEAAGAVIEIKSFWSKLFGSKPKAKQAVQQARKKDAYVAIDETQVMSNIVTQLTTFFKLQDQLMAHLREEEEKSKTIYDPDANLMEAALKRLMVVDQLALLEVEIREVMTYGAPKEMGALYSRTFETRDIIQEEQNKARKKRDEDQWLRKEEERLLKERQAYLLATLLFLLYMWLLLGLLSRTGE